MPRPKTLFLATTLLFAAGTLYFLLREPEQKITYATAHVERGDILQTVSSTGTLQALNTVQVGSQVSGTIKEIRVDYNSVVTTGQVIARIDPTLFEAEVAGAEADLASAKASVTEALAQLSEANKNAKRQKRLFASDFISASEVDASETSLTTARSRLVSSRASVLQAEAALLKAKTNLGYTTIVSPVDGVVIGKDVSAGQTVAASLQTPTLFTIAEDLTRMQVEADVDEADIGYVTEGAAASFYVDAYPEKTFRGRVRQVRLQPLKTENVVTYTVIIEVGNPDLFLKPGMTANISIETARAENILKVPSLALRFAPEGSNRSSPFADAGTGKGAKGTALWILSAGGGETLLRVPVVTGISDGSYTEVSGNLEAGSQVVLSSSGQMRSAEQGTRRPRLF
ncbi:MAG: efflux RND transporter periplasmic adaptor subunit [Thermovirgaceae bacterium]